MWLHADIANVADIVRHHARTGPRRTALVEGRFTLSWGELDEVSSRLAAALRRAGVREGDVVAYLGRNSIPFFEVLYGAAKAGATLLPLNWRLAAPELAAIVDDAAPAVVFAEQDLLALLEASLAPTKRPGLPRAMLNPQAGVHGGLESYWDDSPADDPGGPSDPRGTAWLMYTSGTTGRAKGVELSHQGLDRMRLVLSVQAMYTGCTVSIMPMLEPGRLLALVRETRPTILVVAPTVIQMMLDHPDAAAADLSSLRLVMYAGSAISATLLKRALARFGCDFMQFYGATESGGAMSILRPEQHDLEDESKLRSCGTPLPLVDFRIAGAQGEELPDGQIGEIVVRSPALFTGYRNQREQTAAVLSHGWYRTGDAGYRDPKDGLYYIVDRVKDMIVTGGENVYSAEVEQAIQKHPGVAMSAVVAAPDERWGERVTAVIVPRPGVELTPEAIVAHCREHIAGYKVPKQVVFETALPLSPAGKVLKRVLRDRFWEGHTRGVA